MNPVQDVKNAVQYLLSCYHTFAGDRICIVGTKSGNFTIRWLRQRALQK